MDETTVAQEAEAPPTQVAVGDPVEVTLVGTVGGDQRSVVVGGVLYLGVLEAATKVRLMPPEIVAGGLYVGRDGTGYVGCVAEYGSYLQEIGDSGGALWERDLAENPRGIRRADLVAR